MTKFIVLTLFKEMFDGFLKTSIIKRAIDKEVVDIQIHNFREFTHDKHKHVDDYPYGGGAGMVISPQPVVDSIRFAKKENKGKVIFLGPRGVTFNQELAKKLSKEENLIFVCGHYEGIDQRVIDKIVDEEISIGDYVLTGGELPAMVLIDSVSRYVDGVLSNDSTSEESFSQGILEYPQYTRPETFEGVKVPEILQSGHHENINKWRRCQALKNTYYKRPELLKNVELSEKDKKYLDEIKSKKDIK